MFTITLVAALIFLLVILGRGSNKPQVEKVLQVMEIDDEDTQTIRAMVKSRWPRE